MSSENETHPDSASAPIVQVLALDGGGLRGIFAAEALAQWETDYQVEITDHFDLVVGTSAGGIIALALGAGLRPHEVVDLYRANADAIFPKQRPRGLQWVRWARRPKHDPRPLRAMLDRAFGGLKLGDSASRLAIPSYDLAADDVHLFRTPHHQDLRRDWRISMVDVAMATAAAPTFLEPVLLNGHRLVDGGVWANNPTVVGVAEAVDRLNARPDRVRILNVGTTTEIRDRATGLDVGGLWAWRLDGLDVVLRGQALSAVNHARLIVGRENVTRVDMPIAAGRHQLDSVDVADLVGKAGHASRISGPSLDAFFNHSPAPYEPIYSEETPHEPTV